MSTLDYYNQKAKIFMADTVNADFTRMQDYFLEKVSHGGLILDFGCGSGRDSRYFLEKGYKVEAIDGSEELCRLASAYTGIPVKHMLFHELCEFDKYDAIWACASILHVPKREMEGILKKLVAALKKNGVLYISYKYGDFEGERGGRYFSNYTEESFHKLLSKVEDLSLMETFQTSDVRPGREAEAWLNLLLKKE